MTKRLKEKQREQIQKDTEEFLAKGNTITVLSNNLASSSEGHEFDDEFEENYLMGDPVLGEFCLTACENV